MITVESGSDDPGGYTKAGHCREEYGHKALQLVVCFLYALFFFLIQSGITPSNRNFTYLPIFAYANILALLWQAGFLNAWSYAVRFCLKTKLHYNWSFGLPPCRNLQRPRQNKGKISELSFTAILAPTFV